MGGPLHCLLVTIPEYILGCVRLQARLTRGILPQPKRWEWPQEPFQSTFAKAMRSLEMPRFCRRYPKLTDAVLRQMLELLQVCLWSHDFLSAAAS